MAFADARVASETLAAVSANPHIVSAVEAVSRLVAAEASNVMDALRREMSVA